MAKFVYYNSKNANTSRILFKLNCDYHRWVFFDDEYNIYSKFSSANGLAKKLRELINIYHQDLLHTQDLEKQAHDKGVSS